MAGNPFATSADGSAKDPAAYGAALRADPERVKALSVRPRRSSDRPAGRLARARRGCTARRCAGACDVAGRMRRGGASNGGIISLHIGIPMGAFRHIIGREFPVFLGFINT